MGERGGRDNGTWLFKGLSEGVPWAQKERESERERERDFLVSHALKKVGCMCVSRESE